MQLITWTETVNSICNIVLALVAITATFAGFYGFKQWRRELRGRAQHEIARELVRIAFEFQARYHFARNPISFSSEWSDRIISEGEKDSESRALNNQYGRYKRLDSLRETVYKLQQLGWEGRIIIDSKLTSYINNMVRSYAKLSADIQAFYVMDLQPSGRSENTISILRVIGVESRYCQMLWIASHQAATPAATLAMVLFD